MKWLILIPFLLAGCAKTVYVPVVQSRMIIDTVVQSSEDSTLLRALFECDSSGKVLLRELNSVKGKTARQNIEFENNEIVVKTQWQTKLIERQIQTRDTITVVDFKSAVESKPYIPKFFWGCFAVALLVVILIVWRVIKLFL